MLKISSGVTLRQTVHTQNGKPVYYLDDPSKKATYPLRNQLGRNGLGMQWWGAKAMWYTYHISPALLSGLKKLGIDTSPVEGGSVAPTTPDIPAAPVIDEPVSPVEETTIPTVQVDKEWNTDKYSREFRASEKSGFPIKKGIYTQNVALDFQGQTLNLTLNLNRKFMPGKTSDEYNPTIAAGWKGFPIYEFEIMDGEKLIHTVRIPLNRKAPEKRWQQINESSEIVPQMEELLKQYAVKPDTKTYQRLQIHVQVNARDPELVQFIEQNSDKTFETRDIQIPFSGENYTLPVGFKIYVPYGSKMFTLSFVEALDRAQHPGAPDQSYSSLGRVDVPLTIRTLEEFKAWVEQQWNDAEVQKEIIENYQHYLKSFPFTAESHQKASGDMGVILSMLVNDVVDTQFFKKKLMELGYLRPSKKQGRPRGLGMEPESRTVYVLDHSKITNDIYGGRDRISPNDPQYFYTCMAYYLHRLKKNIQSFTDMMLTTSMSQWVDTGKRYGLDLHWREVYAYFDKASRKLFKEIFLENAPNSWSQNYNDFYSGNYGTGKTEEPVRTVPVGGGLDDFVNFAVSLGADASLARSDPKKVYRQLAIKNHPDLNPGNPQAENNFKQLSNLWSRIEGMFRQGPRTAKSWLQRILTANKIQVVNAK